MGFLYTDVIRVLLGPGETRVSKQGYGPIVMGIFHIKLCAGVCGVDVLEELVVMFCLLMTEVSSLYLIQSLGGLGTELMVLDSIPSMKRWQLGG